MFFYTNNLIPDIIVLHLSYTYPQGALALDDVSFEILRGEKVALLGPNGAGKSTLLLHLNGVIPSEGKVIIQGIKLTKQTVSEVRARVGMVFQEADDQLFSTTIFDDVAYGPRYMGLPKEEVQLRVREALDEVGLVGFEKRHPYHLSVGEKRRAALATVLSMRSPILVIDEPSAGLDPRGRRELIELLQSLPQTLVLATHDLELAKQVSSRAIVLNHGKIVSDEACSVLFNDHQRLVQFGLV